jgi:hypothetical protein
MNYLKIYNDIVGRGKNRVLEGYKERHHIVPRCLGGTDDESNLVELTPEEHFVAHQLLVKLHPTNSKLIFATNMLTISSGNVKRNNKMYGWLKRKFSENTSGDNHCLRKNGEARKKNQEYMTGPNNPSTLNGTWNKGLSVKLRKTDLTLEEREQHSTRMKKNNPCAGVKPWKHGRATAVTKAIWARADEIYNVWLTNDKPAFCKLFGLCMNKKYDWKNDGKEVGPFMNMVKYFRNGWVPAEDLEWKELKETV